MVRLEISKVRRVWVSSRLMKIDFDEYDRIIQGSKNQNPDENNNHKTKICIYWNFRNGFCLVYGLGIGVIAKIGSKVCPECDNQQLISKNYGKTRPGIHLHCQSW